MNQSLLFYLSENIGEAVKTYQPVSGGDISDAYLITTSSNRYFLKTNNASFALKMFTAERNALELIGNTDTIRTPKIIQTGQFQKTAFLLMEFIESKEPNRKDFEQLGYQLARLHQKTNSVFGFEEDNFIGRLIQSNQQHSRWIDFYVQERIEPQLNMAHRANLLSASDVPSIQKMTEVWFPLFAGIQPSLLHGDLWSGNFLISTDGSPYLIDTATYYGHGEVDIAMSRLFGGFGNSFYEAYFEQIPKQKGLEERNKIYQLYYLLVHLNLFGRAYYSSVREVLKYFFN